MFLAAQERGCVRPVALMAALTQGRNFLLRGVSKEVDQAREDTLGEEHESDFFLLMRAWRYADKANYSLLMPAGVWECTRRARDRSGPCSSNSWPSPKRRDST